MVKSRRSASRFQSRPNATLAWRPKVSTSSRRVVTSNGRPSTTTVTVPCSMPVGTALKPAACSAAHHLGRQRGGGDVDVAERHAEQRVAHRAADDARLLAVAVEHGEQIRQAGRLQPFGIEPTRDLCHLVSPGTKLAVLDVGGNVGRARRRAAPLREHDEAADHQDERRDQQPGDAGQRPGVRMQHARFGRPQEDGIGDERRQEQGDFGKDRTDHGKPNAFGIIIRARGTIPGQVSSSYAKADAPVIRGIRTGHLGVI